MKEDMNSNVPDAYIQRYLCPHPTILMIFSSGLLGGTATPPEISAMNLCRGHWRKAENMLKIWSPGLQRKDT